MTREEAIRYIKRHIELYCVTGICLEAEKMAIEALKEKEQNKGHWIERVMYSDGKHKIECSECKSHIFDRGHANSFNVKNKYKFCPNCGCRMVEPQESEE